MREPRSAEGARSLHGLPAPQSPSCDPSREGRPGREGGGGRGGGRLPHRHLREALLVRSRRRLVRRLRAPEREKDEGTEAPRAAPAPEPGSAAGPSRRGGRTLVLRAAGGASSSAAERRRCLRAARRVCSLCASSAPAGATRSSAVGLLGCLCALLLPALPSPGFSGPHCYG